MSDLKTRTVRGWVAMTPRGRLVKIDDDGYFVTKRGHGWCDDTKWVRATQTITIEKPVDSGQAKS